MLIDNHPPLIPRFRVVPYRTGPDRSLSVSVEQITRMWFSWRQVSATGAEVVACCRWTCRHDAAM